MSLLLSIYDTISEKSVFNEEVMIMSRNIKGGFLTLSGVVGIVGMIIAAMQNPATAWVTPPGRMIVSILENGFGSRKDACAFGLRRKKSVCIRL